MASRFEYNIFYHLYVRFLFFTSNLRDIFIYNSCGFSYKFAFILFVSFLKNQKQESGFQQVGDLVTRILFVFCLQLVVLYFKAMPNSADFYKGIFFMLLLFVLWCHHAIQYTIVFYVFVQFQCDFFLKYLTIFYIATQWVNICSKVTIGTVLASFLVDVKQIFF